MKRGAPIQRRSRLRRRTPMRQGRGPAGDNPAYLQAVRELGYYCAARYFRTDIDCAGRLDPHHAGRRPGIGMKAPDDTAIPICRWHHRALECLYGPFHHWTGLQVRTWEDLRIDETRAVVFPLLEEGA